MGEIHMSPEKLGGFCVTLLKVIITNQVGKQCYSNKNTRVCFLRTQIT